MAILYEYGKWVEVENPKLLKEMLKDIWKERKLEESDPEKSEEEENTKKQPFLQFDGNEVKANNYVGFIQNGEDVLEIYPKVFREHFKDPLKENEPPSKEQKELMLRHIFYWFGYCRKWKFPFNQASLDTIDIDEFPELIINLIAHQFLETVSNQPFMMYQGVEEALVTPRGSINFKRYINNSFSRGNFHILECDHEPFLFDNRVNRVIKYCSRLLMSQTKFSDTVRMLQEVIFILDEVEDVYCTVHDLDAISLNPFFTDYSQILGSCRLILSQQLYSGSSYDMSQWCLLFPMEYIFEDFLAGFLEEKFSKDWTVEYQKSNMNLSNDPNAFNMKHDIYLTSREKSNIKIIIDTKYKLRNKNFKNDVKRDIAQSDLYQMVSYAFKRGSSEVLLVYPNLSDELNSPDKFKIISGFPGNAQINITAMEIPFISLNEFGNLDEMLYEVLDEQLGKYL